jgi:hypothetical protein
MDPQARAMNYSAILIVAVLLLLAAAVPIWRHSRPWGYVPSVVLFWPSAGGFETVDARRALTKPPPREAAFCCANTAPDRREAHRLLPEKDA